MIHFYRELFYPGGLNGLKKSLTYQPFKTFKPEKWTPLAINGNFQGTFLPP